MIDWTLVIAIAAGVALGHLSGRIWTEEKLFPIIDKLKNKVAFYEARTHYVYPEKDVPYNPDFLHDADENERW